MTPELMTSTAPLFDLPLFALPLPTHQTSQGQMVLAQSGRYLLEASAGTGKTWTIAGLYIRFILETSYTLDQLLVLTYSKAATSELQQRLRARLDEVQQVLHTTTLDYTSSDPLLQWVWHNYGGLQPTSVIQGAQQRIAHALAMFDLAAIFTLHGFCQRMLQRFALETHMPAQEIVLQDESQRITTWVTTFYHELVHQPMVLALLKAVKFSPQKLKQTLQLASNQPMAIEDFSKHQSTSFNDQTLRTQAEQLYDALITQEKITLHSSPDNPTADGLDETGRRAILKFATSTAKAKVALQQEIKVWVTDYVLHFVMRQNQQVQHSHQLTYADLLTKLHRALTQAATGESLAQAIRHLYPIALVDEFQDTDAIQFLMIQALYPHQTASLPYCLVLVGDPKQAIYGFRGGDLAVYRAASASVDDTLRLTHNFRSSQQMVGAVNALFARLNDAEWVGLPFFAAQPSKLSAEIVTHSRSDESSISPSTRYAGLVLDQLSLNPEQDCGTTAAYWNKDHAIDESAQKTAAWVHHLLGQTLQITTHDAETKTESQTQTRPIVAADIAILVRSHKQGIAVQQACQAAGIAVVMTERSLIFASPDALMLQLMLQAIVAPEDHDAIRRALLTRYCHHRFGCGHGVDIDAPHSASHVLSQLARYLAEPTSLDQWQAQLLRYQTLWRTQGLGRALWQWMTDEDIPRRLLAYPDGERRYTNLQHLIELIVSIGLQFDQQPHAVVDWLAQQRQRSIRNEPEDSDDASNTLLDSNALTLRLESDATRVTIMTMHASKGLEFPIVIVPSLWDATLPKDEPNLIASHLKLFLSAEDKAQRRVIEHQELWRLTYVALTRAKYLTVGIWGSVKSGAGATPNILPAAFTSLVMADHVVRDGIPDKGFTPMQLKEGIDELISSTPYISQYETPTDAAISLSNIDSTPSAGITPIAQITSPHDPHVAMPINTPTWRMMSYSQWMQHFVPTHTSTTRLLPAPVLAPVVDSTDLAESDTAMLFDDVQLPAGAAFGSAIHQVLERIPFHELAPVQNNMLSNDELSNEVLSNKVRQTIMQTCQEFAVPLQRSDTQQKDLTYQNSMHADLTLNAIATLLQRTVTTPLPTHLAKDGQINTIRLCDLAPTQYRSELAFTLRLDPTQPLPWSAFIAALLTDDTLPEVIRDHLADLRQQPNAWHTLQGYLKGFIDVVYEHAGRYYILDYKTNRLTAYDAIHVEYNMAKSFYMIQAIIYILAIYRILRCTTATSEATYEKIGGAIYLYVRGSGVFYYQPPLALLQTLDELLG
jgi:exodeoxyribonuclease V beta subunit